jgi:hypothetical protein
LETPPDSGSLLRSQKLRHNRRSSASQRTSVYSTAKTSRQTRQKASVSPATSPPVTQMCYSWSQDNTSSATRSSKFTRSSQKVLKENNNKAKLLLLFNRYKKKKRSYLLYVMNYSLNDIIILFFSPSNRMLKKKYQI